MNDLPERMKTEIWNKYYKPSVGGWLTHKYEDDEDVIMLIVLMSFMLIINAHIEMLLLSFMVYDIFRYMHDCHTKFDNDLKSGKFRDYK